LVAEYGRGKHALPTVRLVRTAALLDGSIVHATRSWYGRAWYDAVRIDQQQGGEGSETLTLYARVVAIYQYGPDSNHAMQDTPLLLCEWLEAHDPIVERAGRARRGKVTCILRSICTC
jgi:hypothetical protein